MTKTLKTNFKGSELFFITDELLGDAAAESFRKNIMSQYPYMDQNQPISSFLFSFFTCSNPNTKLPFFVEDKTVVYKGDEKIVITGVDGLVQSISYYRKMKAMGSNEWGMTQPTRKRVSL